jgi:hypothetical protein
VKASSLAPFVALLVALGFTAIARPARAQDPSDDPWRTTRAEEEAKAPILDQGPDDLRLESFDVQLTGFSQHGHGFQSQAGPTGGPGSEALTVFEPQAFIVMRHGSKLTYRLSVPFDMVTAASPNALDSSPQSADVISNASRQNEAGSIDGAITYDATRQTSVTLKSGIHLEEDFRSFNAGMMGTRTFADENTTLSLGANEIYDWFDQFDVTGHRHGRTQRGTSSGFIALTQILTPTTVAHVNYGITEQNGTLGNTWNAVPLTSGRYGPEILPSHRLRHALVGRIAQWLPWNGALKGFYRFYADDWGVVAHTAEVQLHQRVTPWLVLRASYRYHYQNGVDFFTTLAFDDGSNRTADSDLARFDAQSVGFGATVTMPVSSGSEREKGSIRAVELAAGYERYFRTNDLDVNVAMMRTGLRF